MTVKTLTKLKIKFAVYAVFSFFVSVLPVALILFINWGKYTGYTVAGTLRLGVGAIIACTCVVLKIIGKLKMPRRIILFASIFAMSYLLQPVLADLMLISGMALAGEFVDFLFFQTAIKKIKDEINTEKASDATATKVEEIIKKYTTGDSKA